MYILVFVFLLTTGQQGIHTNTNVLFETKAECEAYKDLLMTPEVFNQIMAADELALLNYSCLQIPETSKV